MIHLRPIGRFHLNNRREQKMKKDFRIGVIIDSFLKASFKEGLDEAVRVGAEGMQVYAVSGEMAPWNLNASQRREKRDLVADTGLVISALCGDLGGHGFMIEEENADKIEKSKQIVDLALELDTNIITTHIGVVPEDKNDRVYDTMLRACGQLAEYANSVGAFFAIETGPETAHSLREFLDLLPGKGVAVNFDPANLVMLVDGKPADDVKTLAPYIVHTHAKDGIKIKGKNPTDVKKVLDAAGYGHIDFRNLPYYELPLGKGHVNFETYLQALKNEDFDGFLTIERETGDTPFNDIKMAVDFLKDHIARVK